MRRSWTVPIICWALFIAGTVFADGDYPQGIRLDGSLGSAGALELEGPDYAIPSDYGALRGANLFHSFERFNLHHGESAAFSGPETVERIISRVTGGDASWIDGRLGVEIPGADLYFLNPAGVMFGPNAALDLTGSFHVSTADYLRFGEADRFYAAAGRSDVLATAPPAAFGFLDGDIGGISVEGRGEITQAEWAENPTGLHVGEGQSVSLIGGDIQIRNGTYYVDAWGPFSTSELKAPGGRVTLAAAASAGEVVPGSAGPGLTGVERMGDIALAGGANISLYSDAGSGALFIRTGRLGLDGGSGMTAGERIDIGAAEMDILGGSFIVSTADAASPPGGLDIRVRDELFMSGLFSAVTVSNWGANPATPGAIDLHAGTLRMENGAVIDSVSDGESPGGDIRIRAGNGVSLSAAGTPDESLTRIESLTLGEAPGGTVEVLAQDLRLEDGAQLRARSLGTGPGGDVLIRVENDLVVAGETDSGSFGTALSADAEGAAPGGDVRIHADRVQVIDGAKISASSLAGGDGGNLTIDASAEIAVLGRGSHPALITVNAVQEGGGDAGNIALTAPVLRIADDGGIVANTFGIGVGGNIAIRCGDIRIENRGSLEAGSDGEGPAGDIHVSFSGTLTMEDAEITTRAQTSGGGNIHLAGGERVRLNGSRIASNVQTGNDDGGDIRIGDVRFVILHHSDIVTAADAGTGGAIFVRTDHYIASADSRLDASSNRGNDGVIRIDAPELDLSRDLVAVPSTFPDAETWALTPCAARSGADVGSLIFRGREAAPASPEDLRGGFIFP